MKIVQIALAHATDNLWPTLVALTDAGDIWEGSWLPNGKKDPHPECDKELEFGWYKKLPPIPQEEGKVEDKPKAQEKHDEYVPKVGDVVVSKYPGGRFFSAGDKCRLVRMDGDGDWRGDFDGMGNTSVYRGRSGQNTVWCVGNPSRFSKCDEPSFIGKTVSGRRLWGGKGRKERGKVIEATTCKGKDAYRIETGRGRTVLIDAGSAKEV